MSDSYEREQEIFAQALELDPAKRSAFLDEACGSDGDLREQVESLLAAMDEAGQHGFFGQPTSGAEEVSAESFDSEDIRAGR